MKKVLLLLPAIMILAFSCNRMEESMSTNQSEGSEKVFHADIFATRTFIDTEGESSPWHNYWNEGDAINVNGQTSEALAAGDAGSRSADFTVKNFSGSSPYYYATPASAVSGYSDGSATISVPASQVLSSNTYDPSAFIMLGKNAGSSTVLSFNQVMALVEVTTTAPAEGNPKVSAIRIESIGDEKLSGSFTTDYTALSGGTNNYVEMTPDSEVAFGTKFILAIPAQNYANGLRIIISANNGTSMTFSRTGAFNAAAGTLYPVTAPAYLPSNVTINNVWAITSSSIDVRWHGSNTANDYLKSWTIHVYDDSSCTNEVRTVAIPSEASCWSENQTPLTFCIGGLDQDTDYWVKVEDAANGVKSAASSKVTTQAFSPVAMPATITSTGVAFAEDFSEFGWGGDMKFHSGSGYKPSSLTDLSNFSTDGATFQASGTEINFLDASLDDAISASRLEDWKSEGRVYAHPGYLKLGTSTNYGFVVSPAFPIQSGKVATVDITINAAKYNADQADTWAVAIVSTVGGSGRQSDFTWPDSEDGALYREVTINSTSLVNVTAEGMAMKPGDRIAFGRVNGGSNTTARIVLNSIKVEVTGIEDEGVLPDIRVSVLERTSSTLSFTWDEGGSANTDNAKAYTASLFDNYACSGVPVQSYSFPENSAADIWRSNKFPKFIFSGLEQNTQYYLKIVDGESRTSDVIAARTKPFAVVEMPAVAINSTGVVLAEDFGELTWDFEYLNGCVGLQRPSTPDSFKDVEASYVKFVDNAGSGYSVFASSSILASSRLKYWLRDSGSDSRVLVHPGYVTLGSATKSQKGWIITPSFPVEDGKKLTVTVSITAMRGKDSKTEARYALGILGNRSGDGGYAGGLANIAQNIADFGWMASGDRTDAVYRTFTVTDTWAVYTFEGLSITNEDRLLVGAGPSDYAAYSTDSTTPCLNISDITVTVTAIE